MCGRLVPLRTPRLSDDSRCFTSLNITEIHHSIRTCFSEYDWLKLFSASSERKSSLETLYRRGREFMNICETLCGGCITVVRDVEGNVFGCYTKFPWELLENKICHADAFIFKVEEFETKIYKLRSGIRTMQQAYPEYISFQDENGLFPFLIHALIERGSSRPSNSFGNPHLSLYTDFAIEALEVYVIVPHDLCKHWAKRMKRN